MAEFTGGAGSADLVFVAEGAGPAVFAGLGYMGSVDGITGAGGFA